MSSSRQSLVAAALALGLAPGGAGATSPSRLVLLPTENLSDSSSAPAAVGAELAAGLSRRGWEVVAGGAVDGALRELHARRVDSLDRATIPRLLESFDASAAMLTTIETYLPGENAIVAVSARLLGVDGATGWSASTAISADDTAGVLGLGRAADVEAVLIRAIDRLLRDLPGPGQLTRLRGHRGRPFRLGRPATFRSAALAAGSRPLVCLIPFANHTEARAANRLVADLLTRRLWASAAFAVVEPADFRAALLAERVPAIRNLDPERLRAVGARLGTTLFLRGVIWRWREGSPRGAAVSPEVELSLELVDVADGRVLWSAHHARLGNEYRGLFLRGAIGNVAALADQVLAEMVAAVEQTEPTTLHPLPSRRAAATAARTGAPAP